MCSQKITNSLKIPKLDKIDVYETLKNWREQQIRTGFISLPDVAVNGLIHTELLTPESTIEMLCASLNVGTPGC